MVLILRLPSVARSRHLSGSAEWSCLLFLGFSLAAGGAERRGSRWPRGVARASSVCVCGRGGGSWRCSRTGGWGGDAGSGAGLTALHGEVDGALVLVPLVQLVQLRQELVRLEAPHDRPLERHLHQRHLHPMLRTIGQLSRGRQMRRPDCRPMLLRSSFGTLHCTAPCRQFLCLRGRSGHQDRSFPCLAPEGSCRPPGACAGLRSLPPSVSSH